MISTQKNFIFIHYPKTGGSSIQILLSKYSDDELIKEAERNSNATFNVIHRQYGFEKHSKLEDYKEVLDNNTYQKMFKFSTIRNPWDMMISWYFSPHSDRKEWNREKFIQLLNDVSRPQDFMIFSSYLDRGVDKIVSLISPLVDIKLSKKLDRDLDYIIKFENFDKDFKEVCEKLDIPYQKLPHVHKSDRKHYTYYYDNELKEMVFNKFQLEIEFMNYEFEKR